jgi:transposase-like protein
MAYNAFGIRDTARVLHVSLNTVIQELKRRNSTFPGELVSVKATEPR